MYRCYDCSAVFDEREEAIAHYHDLGHKTNEIDWEEVDREEETPNDPGDMNHSMEVFWNKSDR